MHVHARAHTRVASTSSPDSVCGLNLYSRCLPRSVAPSRPSSAKTPPPGVLPKLQTPPPRPLSPQREIRPTSSTTLPRCIPFAGAVKMASDSDDPDYEYHIEWNDGTNVKSASGSRTASAHSRATSSKSRGARNKGKQPMKTVAESSKTAAARPYDGASQPQSHQTSQPASRPSTAEGRKATPNGRPLKTPPVAAGPSNGASVMRTFGHFLQATHQNGQGSNVNWQNAIYSRNQRGEPIAPNNQDVFTNREWGDMRAPGSVVQGPQDVSIEVNFVSAIVSSVF